VGSLGHSQHLGEVGGGGGVHSLPHAHRPRLSPHTWAAVPAMVPLTPVNVSWQEVWTGGGTESWGHVEPASQ
jgi:hypothetical protein